MTIRISVSPNYFNYCIYLSSLGAGITFIRVFYITSDGNIMLYFCIIIIISAVTQIIIFVNPPTILDMWSICVLWIVGMGPLTYTVGVGSDNRSYFTSVDITISLQTGTKIFKSFYTFLTPCEIAISWLYPFSVGDEALFTLISLLMCAICGSTGAIHGDAVVDISLRDTYYVAAHFHLYYL